VAEGLVFSDEPPQQGPEGEGDAEIRKERESETTKI